MTPTHFILDVVPAHAMRYPTLGDWSDAGGSKPAVITAAETGNADYNFLLLVHELVECYLCGKMGISAAAVDAFDMQFERERHAGQHPADAEAGESIHAPYWRQHLMATAIESQMAALLGINWDEYAAALAEVALPDETGESSETE